MFELELCTPFGVEKHILCHETDGEVIENRGMFNRLGGDNTCIKIVKTVTNCPVCYIIFFLEEYITKNWTMTPVVFELEPRSITPNIAVPVLCMMTQAICPRTPDLSQSAKYFKNVIACATYRQTFVV
jgi:hypothetical protein